MQAVAGDGAYNNNTFDLVTPLTVLGVDAFNTTPTNVIVQLPERVDTKLGELVRIQPGSAFGELLVTLSSWEELYAPCTAFDTFLKCLEHIHSDTTLMTVTTHTVTHTGISRFFAFCDTAPTADIPIECSTVDVYSTSRLGAPEPIVLAQGSTDPVDLDFPPSEIIR